VLQRVPIVPKPAKRSLGNDVRSALALPRFQAGATL